MAPYIAACCPLQPRWLPVSAVYAGDGVFLANTWLKAAVLMTSHTYKHTHHLFIHPYAVVTLNWVLQAKIQDCIVSFSAASCYRNIGSFMPATTDACIEV